MCARGASPNDVLVGGAAADAGRPEGDAAAAPAAEVREGPRVDAAALRARDTVSGRLATSQNVPRLATALQSVRRLFLTVFCVFGGEMTLELFSAYPFDKI